MSSTANQKDQFNKTLLIQKDGIFYTLDNTFGDKGDDFYDRAQFIFKSSTKSKDEFNDRVKLSNCYMNHKKLGVVYNDEIMKQF